MKVRLVPVLGAILLLLLALALDSILLWRIFIAVLLVMAAGFLLVLLGSRGLKASTRPLTERCQVGEKFVQEITIENTSRLPKLFLETQALSDLPRYDGAAALSLGAGASRTWRQPVECRRRGRYSMGLLRVTAVDPFGFFTAVRHFGEAREITIYPATPELPFFQPLARNEPVYGRSRWSLINESSPSAAHVREYAEGDRLNWIHWASTAHTGKLMVKEFDPERSAYSTKNIWLLPDMAQSVHAGDGDESTEEQCVTVTAALAKNFIESGKEVGLLATGQPAYLLPPQGGNPALMQVLEALALMRAGGATAIEQVINAELDRFRATSVLVVITPSNSDKLVPVLRQVTLRGGTVIAIIVDTSSFGGGYNPAIANALRANGAQVYVVRKSVDLAHALDSRMVVPHTRYSGEAVG